MYARGMTVREIRGHLQELYGIEVSPDLISTVTDAVLEAVSEWQNRPLDACYAIVFFDAIRVKIRDEGFVRNKAVYIALAILPDGTKEILGSVSTPSSNQISTPGPCRRPRRHLPDHEMVSRPVAKGLEVPHCAAGSIIHPGPDYCVCAIAYSPASSKAPANARRANADFITMTPLSAARPTHVEPSLAPRDPASNRRHTLPIHRGAVELAVNYSRTGRDSLGNAGGVTRKAVAGVTR